MTSSHGLSVVMPVFNAMPHLDAAVRSILDQSYADFEFVIFDDGSSDGSTERLQWWASQDNRIKLFESSANLGPARSSNRAVELASGQLIARMDADDVCQPARLARQVELLEAHPQTCLVATSCDVIGSDGSKFRDPDVWRLTRHSWFAPFAHGSAMFRRNAFDEVGGYREECAFWEDQDLFVRMLAWSGGMIETLPEPLYSVRYSRVSTRVASDQQRVERAVDLMYRSVDRLDQGRWYDDLLETPQAKRLDPRVFIATGSLDLWSGGRPRLFKRLLEQGQFEPSFRWVSALAWTAWASLSPGSLRWFLRKLVWARNQVAQGEVRGNAPIRWIPPTQIDPLKLAKISD